VDEADFVALSKTGAEMLFEVFSQRYERTSTLVTSNLPFAEWTAVLGSNKTKESSYCAALSVASGPPYVAPNGVVPPYAFFGLPPAWR
jgi:hypothetical protein